jgi:hypothetical protein
LRPTCKAPGELLDRDAARNPWTWRCGAYEASVERDSRATPFGLTHNHITINLVDLVNRLEEDKAAGRGGMMAIFAAP